MFEWSETDLMVRDAVRAFIDREIRPNLDALDSGEMLPYPILKKLFDEFGIAAMARDSLEKALAAEEAELAGWAESAAKAASAAASEQQSMMAVLVSELSGVCLGLVSALGVSTGLGAATIQARGTLAQKKRWLPELVTMEKVASWAITEPDSGSDPVGGKKTNLRRGGEDNIHNRQKT